MVLCKPHYTRICESDVKVKKSNIALLKLLFIEFFSRELHRNKLGIFYDLHREYRGDYGTHIERHYTECYVTNGCNERLHSAI